VNVVIASMPEEPPAESSIANGEVQFAQGLLWYTSDRSGTLDLFGIDGRLVQQARLGALQTWSVRPDMPAGTSLVWRFTGDDGHARKGRLVIP
jgi:hypothetical protein